MNNIINSTKYYTRRQAIDAVAKGDITGSDYRQLKF